MEATTPGDGSPGERLQSNRVGRPWDRLRARLIAISRTERDTWSTLASRMVR